MKCRINRIAFASTIIALALGIGASLQPAAAKAPCERNFQKYYSHGPSHAAFATTNGRSPGAPYTACGWSAGASSKKLAMKSAMRSCSATQKRNPSRGVCKVIHVR
jgi:hypothetical protein